MDLDQIKKDIDKIVEDYKENWNSHHKFPDKVEGTAERLPGAFRNLQVYRTMFWMAQIDTKRQEIKNPVVSTGGKFIPKDFEGLDIVLTWSYGKPGDEDYVSVKLEVACEGSSQISTYYGGEYWTNRIERINSYHIADIGELLAEETLRRGKE